jgi:DNA ligase-1
MTFRPMLAVSETPPESWFIERFKKGPLLCSFKLDGIRCLVKDGIAVSRSLKPIKNKVIQSVLGTVQCNGLDGELVVGSPKGNDVFNRTSSGVMSQSGTPDWTYYVFDLHDRSPDLCFQERLASLVPTINGIDNNLRIKSWGHRVVGSIEDLNLMEQQAHEDGFEGLIARDPGGFYKFGRSTLREGWMLKIKRWIDREAVVTGFEPLLENQNAPTKDAMGLQKRSSHKAGKVATETLGKLLVRDGTWEFAIGSGFDDAMRQQIWDNRDACLGKLVTYKYQPHGTIDKPRMPIFKGFRDRTDMS